MKYFTKEERDKLLSELFQRHGKIDKIEDDDGKVFAYLTRAELGRPDENSVDVIMNFSFNFYNNIREYDYHRYVGKYFNQSDLKLFAIKRLLSTTPNKVNVDNWCPPLWVIHWNGPEDDIAFENNIYSIIVTNFNALDDYKKNIRWYGDDKLVATYGENLKKWQETYKYIFKCFRNVLNYYKNKKVRIFII